MPADTLNRSPAEKDPAPANAEIACSSCGMTKEESRHLAKHFGRDARRPEQVTDAVAALPPGDLVADDGTGEAVEAWSKDAVLVAILADRATREGEPVAEVAAGRHGDGADVRWLCSHAAMPRPGEKLYRATPAAAPGNEALIAARAALDSICEMASHNNDGTSYRIAEKAIAEIDKALAPSTTPRPRVATK